MYFVSDEAMLDHKIRWDSYHIECPERLQVILDQLKNKGLLEKSKILPSRKATEEEISIVHKKDYINKVKDVCSKSIEEMEDYCKHVDDVYINEKSYDLALLAAGCTIDATLAAFKHKSSSFAAIRPPGHHSFPDAPCGFCVFNNVVIAAKHARSSGAQRVLIVDWDVHAGQGTQECIEGDEGIRLISSHRFENGTFWPNMEQSGVKHKFSNTMNIPLNSIGEDDSAFISMFNLLILPTIIDYRPDLIIVSCGFDAAIGDPEGEMAVSPYGYGRMTQLLINTGIPVSVILEGGYFLPSIAKDAEYVVRALQGESFNILPSEPISRTLKETFHRIISTSSSPTLQSIHYLLSKGNVYNKDTLSSNEYKGKRIVPNEYPTRGIYKKRSSEDHQRFVDQLEKSIDKYDKQGKKGKNVLITVDKDTAFDIREDTETISINTSPSLYGLVQTTIATYLNPSFPLSFDISSSTPNKNELNQLYDKLLHLSTNQSFHHIPIIQLIKNM